MISRRSVAEHVTAVSALLADLGGRAAAQVPLRDALGMRLAEGIVSPIPLPVFDNSQMDGYAVRSADLVEASKVAPVRLTVGEVIPAGRTDTPALALSTAAPIMTGAPIPNGADAVVPIELVTPARFELAQGELVGFTAPVTPGSFVRPRGGDVAAGELLLKAGTLLHARHLGLLAAAGVPSVPVRARLRILVLSTGSELRGPGEPLAPGQIYDANTTMLAAAVSAAGAEVETALVPDRPDAFVAELRARIEAHPVDVVVTSGGVSAGAFEVVKDALEGATNSKVEFVSVAMQPGGPQGLGVVFGVPLLAFPGNPVSAMVSFEVFLRPVLRKAAGYPVVERPRVLARLTEAATSPPNKHQIRRGVLRHGLGGLVVELTSGPGSHLVAALAHSNALVHIPVGVAELPAGAEVMTWQLETEETATGDLPHLDRHGAAHMVDVSAKASTSREATATAVVRTTAEVIEKLMRADLKKGDGLAVARVAGIMAAKRTAELIPLCHPLPLTSVTVDLKPHGDTVEVTATIGTTAVTGVEMEALTAASVASLTLYDMIKALDPAATVERLAVLRKTGGKTGEWVRDE